MTDFTIENKFLGTSKHLHVSNSGFSWVDSINGWALLRKRAPGVLDILSWAKDIGTQVNLGFPDKYTNPFQEIGYNPDRPIPYHLVSPKDVYDKWLQNVLECCRRLLLESNDNLYLEQFKRYCYLTSRISRCHVSSDEIRRISSLTDNASQLKLLKSFDHDKNGICNLASRYERIQTGRLKVHSGPNILSLKKEYRSILRSRYERGRIVMLDYQSLEPRAAYAIANPDFSDMPDDIYKFINKEILNKKIQRSDLKIAIMASLYGMSAKKLADKLGSVEEAHNLRASIKKIFKIEELYAVLKNSVRKNTLLNNHGWSMQVTESTPLYSHYIQSSASDICIEGFSNICKKIEESNLSITPILLLHDSIFLDVHPDSAHTLKDLAVAGSKISNYNIDFPIKITLVDMPKNNC